MSHFVGRAAADNGKPTLEQEVPSEPDGLAMVLRNDSRVKFVQEYRVPQRNEGDEDRLEKQPVNFGKKTLLPTQVAWKTPPPHVKIRSCSPSKPHKQPVQPDRDRQHHRIGRLHSGGLTRNTIVSKAYQPRTPPGYSALEGGPLPHPTIASTRRPEQPSNRDREF